MASLQLGVGIPMVFFLPGFALTLAIFPANSLPSGERLLFSLGLSLAVTALVGLGLNFLPIGLNSTAWLVALGAVTVVSFVIRPIGNRGHLAAGPSRIQIHARDLALFALAGVLIVAAFAISIKPAPPQGLQAYSLLYMVPAKDGDPSDLRIGVTSDEFGPTSFKIQVKLNGSLVHEWVNVPLKTGEGWEAILYVPTWQDKDVQVQAELYRLDAPDQIYRQVTLQNPHQGGVN